MLHKLMMTTALTGLMIGGALAQNPTTQPMTPTQPQATQPAAQPMPGVNAAERAAQSSPSMARRRRQVHQRAGHRSVAVVELHRRRRGRPG